MAAALADAAVETAGRLLARARRVFVLTGAGVSAESGLPTFRGAGGLWEGHRVEDVATPGAFARDPALVWRFYDARRTALAGVAPNAAHVALAAMERSGRFEAFTLATQNVDGLHRDAGSTGVLEIHGSIRRVRCVTCGRETDDRRAPMPEIPPRCPCGGLLRPAVVWFGEGLPPDVFDAAADAARRCDLCLVIGTSALVHPAASLPLMAAAHGAVLIEVNPDETPVSHLAAAALRAPAAEVLPLL